MQPGALSAGDTAWVLASAALVLLMVPGLAFFYGGLVRGKNVLNTLLMSLAAWAVAGVQWVVIGYSLSFGGSGPWIGNLEWLGLNGAPTTFYVTGSMPLPAIGASAGLSLSADKYGVKSLTYADAFFSKSIRVSKSTNLALGVNAGINMYRADFASLDNTDPLFRDNIVRNRRRCE